MSVYKMLIALLAALALSGCSTKSWDWFFEDDEEELVYEEVETDEEMIEEDFEMEDELVYKDEDEMMEDGEMMADEKMMDKDTMSPRRGPRYRDEDRKERRMSQRRDSKESMSDREMQEDRQADDMMPKRTIIHFGYKKSRVSVRDIKLLEKHARMLKSDPSLIVTVEGHTDSVASVGYNKKLGMKRARMVADLLEEMGVDSAQIVTVSYGEERPLETGNSKRAHETNRRVELIY